MSEMYRFSLRYQSTQLFFGERAIDDIESFIESLGGELDIVIAMGRSSAKVSGAFDDVLSVLKKHEINYVVYDKITPNPWTSQVDELARLIREIGADLVIAIGGGSVIDTAKFSAVLALSGGTAEKFIRGEVRNKRSVPVIAVNLTHGTGTEIDRYSVATIDDKLEKHGLATKYPEIGVDDPRYTLSLDKKQTIYTSIDAFYHAYESATSTERNIFIRSLSTEAIRLIHSYLPRTLNNLRDLEARTYLLYASMIAGIAIDTGSTHLNHALEHVFSGLNPSLAHGAGLGVLGPRVIYYTHKAVPEDSAEVLRTLDPSIRPSPEDAEKAERIVREFMERIGFRERLSDYGFGRDDLSRVIEYFHRIGGRSSATPFEVSDEIVRDIFLSSL